MNGAMKYSTNIINLGTGPTSSTRQWLEDELCCVATVEA